MKVKFNPNSGRSYKVCEMCGRKITKKHGNHCNDCTPEPDPLSLNIASIDDEYNKMYRRHIMGT